MYLKSINNIQATLLLDPTFSKMALSMLVSGNPEKEKDMGR